MSLVERKRKPSPGLEPEQSLVPCHRSAPELQPLPLARVPSDAICFLYKGEHLEIARRTLFLGAAPGWLLSSEGDSFLVPDETPLVPELAPAFWRLLQLIQQEVPLAEGFSKQFALVPAAFLASHMLGMEKSCQELRGLCLRRPAELLVQLRKADRQVLLRAFDLGLARAQGPQRPYVADMLEAAEDLLRLSSSELQSAVALQPQRLLHFFYAARLLRLRATQRLLRSFGAGEASLETSSDAALRCAVGDLDVSWEQNLAHLAARKGDLHRLTLALEKLKVNCLTADGETPAMLAAAAGHANVLRFLMRQQADVFWRNKRGLNALDYAARNGHQEVLRLLRDPLSQLR